MFGAEKAKRGSLGKQRAGRYSRRIGLQAGQAAGSAVQERKMTVSDMQAEQTSRVQPAPGNPIAGDVK
jgi:hypothetical protein